MPAQYNVSDVVYSKSTKNMDQKGEITRVIITSRFPKYMVKWDDGDISVLAKRSISLTQHNDSNGDSTTVSGHNNMLSTVLNSDSVDCDGDREIENRCEGSSIVNQPRNPVSVQTIIQELEPLSDRYVWFERPALPLFYFFGCFY